MAAGSCHEAIFEVISVSKGVFARAVDLTRLRTKTRAVDLTSLIMAMSDLTSLIDGMELELVRYLGPHVPSLSLFTVLSPNSPLSLSLAIPWIPER